MRTAKELREKLTSTRADLEHLEREFRKNPENFDERAARREIARLKTETLSLASELEWCPA